MFILCIPLIPFAINLPVAAQCISSVDASDVWIRNRRRTGAPALPLPFQSALAAATVEHEAAARQGHTLEAGAKT